MTMAEFQQRSRLKRWKVSLRMRKTETPIPPPAEPDFALSVFPPLDEEDDDRDEQGVNNQGLDQDQAEDEQEPDMGSPPGIPGNALAGAGQGLGLAERPRDHGQRDDAAAQDQGQFEERCPVVGQAR